MGGNLRRAVDPLKTSDVQCNRSPVAEWLAYPLTDLREIGILP
jgi:hypothetical protein